MNRKQFINRNKVGLILRAFAKRPEDVADRVRMLSKTVRQSTRLAVEGKPLIATTLILVWRDETNFPGQGDCGELAPALREHFAHDKSIRIHEVNRGDLFCGLLNHGISRLAISGCTHAIIASAEAESYWNPALAEQFVDAFCEGALVAGLAINELTDSILEGRIANTFAMWDIDALQTVGTFDLRARKPGQGDLEFLAEGWDEEKEFHQYPIAGVEEMIPLSRLIDLNGKQPCIAPILPTGENQRYVIPNPNENPELYKRHKDKFGTKTERQMIHLASIGADFRKLRGGVMTKYRTW